MGGRWRVTSAALDRLGATDAFREFAARWDRSAPGDPMTPTRAYGSLVDHSGWDSAGAMRSALSDNHGGGIPITVIDAFVACCSPAFED
ncbi:MAG: hypothetical protein RL531_2 [Actinomycetota bacterium]|jgi:hypothetical protein